VENSTDFLIRFSRKLNYDDIKENNTIYIGPLKNKNKFLDYMNEKNKNLKIKNRLLTYKNKITKKDTIIDLQTVSQNKEYALVSRIKSTNEAERFLFFSDHDIGVIATVEYFTNKKNLKEFQSNYLKNNESFTAVFIVEGKERTNLGLELILVDNKGFD